MVREGIRKLIDSIKIEKRHKRKKRDSNMSEITMSEIHESSIHS